MMRRRDFITLVGGAAAWPLTARAHQAATPVGLFGLQPVKATDVGISFAETSDLSAFSGDHRGEAIRHHAAMPFDRWTTLALG